MLKDPYEVDKWVRTILQERSRLAAALHILPICKRIFPSEANFLLVEMTDANGIYDYLLKKGIIVRNRHRVDAYMKQHPHWTGLELLLSDADSVRAMVR